MRLTARRSDNGMKERNLESILLEVGATPIKNLKFFKEQVHGARSLD